MYLRRIDASYTYKERHSYRSFLLEVRHLCLELRGSCLIFLSHGRQLFCELRGRGLLCLYHTVLLSLLDL